MDDEKNEGKESKKKPKVIHARVSDKVDDALKDRAERLGVSVSNLVRNILQNTFGLVENIVADGADIARSANPPESPTEDSAGTPSAPSPQILGWQEAILALNALCQRCNAILARGTRAAIAVPTQAGAFLCLECLKEQHADEEPHDSE